ncbi:MAG: helix-turn-helix domain-containing protein [Pirellulales bacterium]
MRELRNLMERLAYLTTGDRVEADDLAFILPPGGHTVARTAGEETLADATVTFQTDYIKASIERTRGNMSAAAELLGLHRSNLYRKMRQLGMHTDEDENAAPSEENAAQG